jgi:hypothetical protein
VQASHNWFVSNTFSFNRYGFFVSSAANNNTFNSNTIYNSTLDAFNLYNNENNTMYNTTMYNNYRYGLTAQLIRGITTINASNATNNLAVQYHFDAANLSLISSAAYSTPSTALDINATNATNITSKQGSVYTNFTTSYGTITFHEAINVSIKTMSNDSAGVNASGCGTSGYSTCTIASSSNNVINLTNNSASGIITLGAYYDTNYSSSDIYISKYNSSAGGWVLLNQSSINASTGLVTYENITSFSYFAPVRFVASSSTTTTPSSSESSQSSITLSYAATCPDNNLTVSVSSGANTEVRLLLTEPYEGLVSSVTTNNNQAAFTLSKAGTYQVTALKPGYKLTSLTFSYTMCNVTGENQTTLPPTIPPLSNITVPANDTNVTPPITPPADQAKTTAESAISAAESAISAAKAAGKDTTTAESKLAEAKTQYNAGDYTKAKQLADEALTLAQNASVAQQPPTTPATTKTEDTKPKTDDGLLAGLGLLGLLLFIVVLLAVVAGVYFFFMKKGGENEGSGKYKPKGKPVS